MPVLRQIIECKNYLFVFSHSPFILSIQAPLPLPNSKKIDYGGRKFSVTTCLNGQKKIFLSQQASSLQWILWIKRQLLLKRKKLIYFFSFYFHFLSIFLLSVEFLYLTRGFTIHISVTIQS